MTIVSLEVGSLQKKESTSTSRTDSLKERYTEISVADIIRERFGWLGLFFIGLMAAAVVVELFESLLKDHVALSYFVPLLIGHGGNTGAQSNATIIRALALGHIRPSDYWIVTLKEALAGGAMGGLLGILVLLVSFVWSGVPRDVAVTVAVALPTVSLWANVLGGLFPLLVAYMGKNPAVVSAPLMTTVVDATGLAM